MNKRYNNREIGTCYEDLATNYLENIGYKIIDKNFRCKIGEIDIIAQDDIYLVFVEVKYRKDNKSGFSVEAVTISKQRIIYKVANFYMLKKNVSFETPVRFDIIGFDGMKISHIKNAFGGI